MYMMRISILVGPNGVSITGLEIHALLQDVLAALLRPGRRPICAAVGPTITPAPANE